MDLYEPPSSIHNLEPEATVEWIMDNYGEDLKRFIFTYVRNKSHTDDLFQEILIIIYKRIDSFQERSSLKTWLYRITANKCKDYLRSPLNRLMIWKDQIQEGEDHFTPEQYSLMNEQKKEIIQAIMHLPIKYREVLILQYYKEYSVQEMSELLKINASTIKTRVMRAKEKLKHELKEEYLNE